MVLVLSAPSGDCDDMSISTLSLSVESRRRHTTLDAVSSDIDASSHGGSIISRYLVSSLSDSDLQSAATNKIQTQSWGYKLNWNCR